MSTSGTSVPDDPGEVHVELDILSVTVAGLNKQIEELVVKIGSILLYPNDFGEEKTPECINERICDLAHSIRIQRQLLEGSQKLLSDTLNHLEL